jgi:hypothetical protein
VVRAKAGAMFAVVDSDGDGFVGRGELRSGLADLGYLPVEIAAALDDPEPDESDAEDADAADVADAAANDDSDNVDKDGAAGGSCDASGGGSGSDAPGRRNGGGGGGGGGSVRGGGGGGWHEDESGDDEGTQSHIPRWRPTRLVEADSDPDAFTRARFERAVAHMAAAMSPARRARFAVSADMTGPGGLAAAGGAAAGGTVTARPVGCGWRAPARQLSKLLPAAVGGLRVGLGDLRRLLAFEYGAGDDPEFAGRAVRACRECAARFNPEAGGV